MSRKSAGKLRLRRASAVVMGCLALVAAGSGTLAAAAGEAGLDALAAQVDGTAAARTTALQRQYLTRLTAVQTSVAECVQFFRKYGDSGRVAAIIGRVTENPGDPFFTEPEIIDQLKRAVGTDISLTQLDLETCLQAQDRELARGLGADLPGRIGAVDASLKRCIASLKAVGPNAAGVAILERVARRPADDSFTSAATLARLERAVGELGLTPRDLETCVDAFDQNAAFMRSTVVGDNPPPCTSGETLCQVNFVSQTCCSAGETCPTVCGREGCTGYCSSGGCFPADATVTTDTGIKAISDVRLGDRVLAVLPDGTLGYEEVYLNTHRDAATMAPYVVLGLESGRTLRLTPRHFIPVAADAAAAWSARVTKGANEVRAGDFVWSRLDDGTMAIDRVATTATEMAVGAFNPLTMNGTIVVDGVVASAHSDWFLDGLVPAETQAWVYQTVLAPVRIAYRVLGPDRMTLVTEDLGVVDFVRAATLADGRAAGLGWLLLAVGSVAGVGLVALRRRRLLVH